MLIREIIAAVKNESSTSGKKTIISNNMSDVLVQIWLDTYGDQKYFIKKLPDNNFNDLIFKGELTIDDNYTTFHNALTKLANREITGNAAVVYILDIINNFIDEDQPLLKSIVDRNLKVGFSLDNFNSINKISTKFKVALAEKLIDVKGVDILDGTYFVSRKCDGARCITFVNNYLNDNGELIQEIVFKSRQGKVFTTLDNLKRGVAQLTHSLLGQYVLDGECCIVDENGDEHFSWIMQEITRKNHTIINPRYKIFDLLTLDEFVEQKESPIFSNRLEYMIDLFKCNEHENLDLLEQERITSQDDFNRWYDRAHTNSWEGVMLRKDVPFKAGRSKDLIKVKDMQDAEYVVNDIVKGQATYNEGGHKIFDVCSALVITHKGNRVEVGSGLSKTQRLRWYDHPEEIIGKTITVQYFEETHNKKDDSISLRFPVLKYIYDEEGRTV